MPCHVAVKFGYCPRVVQWNMAYHNTHFNPSLEGCILGGSHDRKIAFLLHSQKKDLTFILGMQEFPIYLAFAMTINKSQGKSVLFVGIDLLR